MADDLFVALVKGDERRAGEVDAAGELAATIDAADLLDTADHVQHAARRISMAAIAVRESRRLYLMSAVSERVTDQADALKRVDPTKIKAITDADIAAHKAEQIQKSTAP